MSIAKTCQVSSTGREFDFAMKYHLEYSLAKNKFWYHISRIFKNDWNIKHFKESYIDWGDIVKIKESGISFNMKLISCETLPSGRVEITWQTE